MGGVCSSDGERPGRVEEHLRQQREEQEQQQQQLGEGREKEEASGEEQHNKEGGVKGEMLEEEEGEGDAPVGKEVLGNEAGGKVGAEGVELIMAGDEMEPSLTREQQVLVDHFRGAVEQQGGVELAETVGTGLLLQHHQ